MMTICPICKSKGALRRGHVAPGIPGYSATASDARYFVVCQRCGSQFSVPAHEYFQLYSHDASGKHNKQGAA